MLAEPSSMAQHANPVILVVEDNHDLRATIHDLLETESFTCWTAETADDALRQLEARPDQPDVILLDVVMPGMPAVDFVQKFRQHADWDHTRIVFMTGLASYSIPRSVHVDGVVQKPFTPDQLFRAVRSVL